MRKSNLLIQHDEHATIAGVDGKKVFVFDSAGNLVTFEENPLNSFSPTFVDEASPITYVSMEDDSANWAIMKVDETSGVVITYATELNNPTYTDIATARTDRATLTYQLPNLAF